MSLTGASYWHTRSDCLPANDRQISAASRSVERERERERETAPLISHSSTKAYRSYPQGMLAPIVPASPAWLCSHGSLWSRVQTELLKGECRKSFNRVDATTNFFIRYEKVTRNAPRSRGARKCKEHQRQEVLWQRG